MPELPEVETIRQSLSERLGSARITRIEQRFPGVFSDLSGGYALPLTVEGLRRRGKYLLIDLCDDRGSPLILILHFRMTGKCLLTDGGAEPAAHTHVSLFAEDRDGAQCRLDYNDVRRFGRIWLFSGRDETVHPTIRALGPEPLSDQFTADSLWQSIRRHPQPSVKATLLNQAEIAGIGNIYADEALFLAGIRPSRRGRSIRKYEAVRLHQAIRDVLLLGIGHRGTSFRDYVDGLGRQGSFQQVLNVYGRSGAPCRVCGTPLQTATVAGRTTRSCPVCQK